MGIFVFGQNFIKHQQFKQAPEGRVTKLIQLESSYNRNITVKYRYDYEGISYTSNELATFPTFTNKSERFHDIQARSRDPLNFRCFVNPSDPSESVLINDLDYFAYWILLLGFTIFPLLLGCFAIYCGRYERNKANKALHPTPDPLS